MLTILRRDIRAGGLKLESALHEFGVEVVGLTCLDVGAQPEALPTVCCTGSVACGNR